ncbi:hypothetical protein V1264_015587 [Littorina saxatilis]|uniref:Uncharacterized protein n=1 Tax=Littorina saxatilis TaxID=31220 RepID=A0AAN9BM11_9CAEN
MLQTDPVSSSASLPGVCDPRSLASFVPDHLSSLLASVMALESVHREAFLFSAGARWLPLAGVHLSRSLWGIRSTQGMCSQQPSAAAALPVPGSSGSLVADRPWSPPVRAALYVSSRSRQLPSGSGRKWWFTGCGQTMVPSGSSCSLRKQSFAAASFRLRPEVVVHWLRTDHGPLRFELLFT